MSTYADRLDWIAGRLRIEARGLDDQIESVIEPILRDLPDIWVGPAADQLEAELVSNRAVISQVARTIQTDARALNQRADAIRQEEAAAAATLVPLDTVSGAV